MPRRACRDPPSRVARRDNSDMGAIIYLQQMGLRNGNLPCMIRCVFSDLRADIRDAVRGFLRHPAFFCAAVVSLALGIGANTAIFTVANALILRPLPYAD